MPPESQSPASPSSSKTGPLGRVLLAGVRGYQIALSPVLHAMAGPGSGCRFSPTCSHYALEAIATHGAFFGAALATRRVLRCHPWGPSGPDPVPPRAIPSV